MLRPCTVLLLIVPPVALPLQQERPSQPPCPEPPVVAQVVPPEPHPVARRDTDDLRGIGQFAEVLDLPPAPRQRVARQTVQVDQVQPPAPRGRFYPGVRLRQVEMAEVEILVEAAAAVQLARQAGHFPGQAALP